MNVHSRNAGIRRNKYKCFDNVRYKFFKINLDKTLGGIKYEIFKFSRGQKN